jgi:RNA polymerase sigma factor (sigma-70 family)
MEEMVESDDSRVPDSDLIRLSLDDPDHFAQIFERHAPALHLYLSKRSNHSSVDDLLSETFIAAFRGRRNYDLSFQDARPWLYGIATNTLRHRRRSEVRRLAHESEIRLETPDADVADQVVTRIVESQELDRVRRAIALVDDRFADVLMLVAGPALTYEEVARALDIPIGTVRSRASRGRAQLRELLGLTGQYEHEGATNPHSQAKDNLR